MTEAGKTTLEKAQELQKLLCRDLFGPHDAAEFADSLTTELAAENAKLRHMCELQDKALLLSGKLGAALNGLVPDPESLTPEMREKWQKVVDIIYACGDHADAITKDCLCSMYADVEDCPKHGLAATRPALSKDEKGYSRSPQLDGEGYVR